MNKSKEETIRFRLDKSDEVMREAKALVAIKSWSGTVSRLYYSAFHVVSALMLDRDIRIKAHSGAKAMSELHFIKTGEVESKWSKFYTRLFENRNDSDYEDFAVFTADDVLPLVPQTEEFIDVIKRLITKS
jgi:uncharacterized protein (UPF0332 family)